MFLWPESVNTMTVEWKRTGVLRQFIMENTAHFIYIAQGDQSTSQTNRLYHIYFIHQLLHALNLPQVRGKNYFIILAQVNKATQMNGVLVQITGK